MDQIIEETLEQRDIKKERTRAWKIITSKGGTNEKSMQCLRGVSKGSATLKRKYDVPEIKYAVSFIFCQF